MPRVKIDLVAPAFELPASSGDTVASWDFKSRAPLVLFFPHADCAACRGRLLELTRDLGRYAEYEAQVLALLPAALPDCQRLATELQLSFPLLADSDGRVRARYLDSPGAVGLFVLDRYGEPYGRWVAAEADSLPSAEPLLSALRLSELECPECGVPDWS
jgi:peroxiredoxin Q/BCP